MEPEHSIRCELATTSRCRCDCNGTLHGIAHTLVQKLRNETIEEVSKWLDAQCVSRTRLASVHLTRGLQLPFAEDVTCN